MSTTPGTLSPGLRLGALRTALAALLPMSSVPVVNVLAGLAACAVKSAPDPTVIPTAARTTASALMVRRGCAARADRRDTGGLRGGGTGDTAAGVAVQARTPSGLQPGGAGARDPLRQSHTET